MDNPSLAGSQGYATALMLRKAGVNVDLAPVADVTGVDGFMTTEQRTFGSSSPAVARAACAFARGLVKGGVAYTLKHFPGLGDAMKSTDLVPVAIDEPAAEVEAGDAAYRSCGSGPLALVMVSSASYTHLTGDLPAVMTPSIYSKVMVQDGISALTVSDALDSGAIKPWPSAARRSIAAGLDMAMYPNSEAGALDTYSKLLADVRTGRLSPGRVRAAAMRVLALKRALGLG
jgi:beta-N-acetylhexosaminidase